MKSLLSLALILFVWNVSFSQTSSYSGFTLTDKPVVHQIVKEFESESAVYVKDERKLELVPSTKGVDFFSSYHKIIRVNDEKGIENFNKIYIPVREDMEIMQIRARTITPENKIIEVGQDAIKDFTDDDNSKYKIFAIDGLTKGSEIEYSYTIKRTPLFFGKEIFQFKIPLMDGYWELVTPATIKFEAKAFNTTIQPQETVDEEKNIRVLKFNTTNVQAYTDEKYAMISPSLQQVQYKLSYTESRGMNVRMFTWNELAKDVYENYNQFSKKEIDVADDFLKKADIKSAITDEEKIKKIENYVKNTVKTGEDVEGDDFNDFSKIQRNKIASYKGIGRLTCAMLQRAGVKYEVVFTGDRENYVLERSFENWNHAENLLLHFPSLKKFIAPTSFLYRYPFVPSVWAGTLGLYCVPVEVGEMKSALAEVKGIPMEPVNHSHHDLESVISFNKAMDTAFVTAKHIHSGYGAPLYKAQLIFLPADEQRTFMKEMAKNSAKTENILSQEIQNKELEITDEDKPFIVNLKMASVDLFESAGDKILLKIGECIGPQVEMYNEHQRQFDIEIDYPHYLNRKIVLEIPEGYRVKNPDDLNFNISYSTNNKVTMCFISSYKIEGNRLEVNISEQYQQLRWPKSEYDNFIKVINASADFNKVVLVLEKK